MKKFRSRLAMILTMAMIITSFTFVGVFAENEEVPAMSTVTAYSSSEAVVFLWDKVEGADGYIVDGTAIPASSFNEYKNGQIRYDKGGIGEGGYASISVQAYKNVTVPSGDPENPTATVVEQVPSANTSTAADNAVQTIRYKLTIKKGGTLKSHGGPAASMRVSKGQTIYAYGFGGGKYIFKNENGSIFYCNKSRTKKRSCVYNNGMTYSQEEAEFFINDKGVSSSTNALVWVNTYTQTTYLFTRTANGWDCYDNFKCSTGKAATPSPTGVYGTKSIGKKIKKRHGIKWWSTYSDINSIHSKKAKWKIGTPSSNGCIRNYEANAYKVYYNAPVGSRVLIF